MGIEVNWLAVVLAVVASMAIGALWYARGVFGSTWMHLAKLDTKKMNERAPYALGVAVVSSFIMSFTLYHMIFLSHNYFNNSWLQDAMTTSFWVWFGFQGLRVVMHDAFEQRRRKLTLINIANDFVTIMAMGLVIGLVK